MKVRLATYSLGTDDNGVEAVGFGFEPADGTEADACEDASERAPASERPPRPAWPERNEERAMSASDDIWILGIHMTKFGKHPDKDIVDLGAEAVQAALADAGGDRCATSASSPPAT